MVEKLTYLLRSREKELNVYLEAEARYVLREETHVDELLALEVT